MPTESTYASFDVPNLDLWAFFFERKDRQYPDDKVIFRDADTGRAYTYAQVKSAAIDFGKGLRALWDWKKGDVLALFCANCIDTPAITWGTHWAGGVLSPANPAYTAEELASQLKDSKAKALCTQKPFMQTALKAAKLAGLDPDMIILMGDERDPGGRLKHFTSIRNISGASRYRRAKVNANEALAFLCYSSGTTGKPKGVMLTHTNICSNVLQITKGEGANLDWKSDKVMAFLPFFHIYGLTCLIMQSMYRGLELVVMSKFELDKFCHIIQQQKITFVYLVPPVLLLLAKDPIVDNYDLSSLRMANCGAAPLTRELVDQVYKRIKLPVKQGYGLTETSPTTHVQPWSDWNKTIGSVGKMLPNLSAKYLDAEDKEVPTGKVGELCMKGPNVFIGYLNQPEMTKTAFTEDGYFRTGDIGYQDAEGNFFITDRVKELIKYKGFQVAPAELEGLLLDHPSIADVAVIGIYRSEAATELPRAYIVLKAGVKGSEAVAKEISDWLQTKVAPYKRLRGGVRFVGEIPKSVSGKVLRRVLKDHAKAEQDGPKSKL